MESKRENRIIPRRYPPPTHGAGWGHERPGQNYRDCESTVHGMAHPKYHRPHDPVSLNKYFSTLFNNSEVQHHPSDTTVPAQKHEVSITFSIAHQLLQFFFLAERRRLPGESWGHVKTSANTLHGGMGRKANHIFLENTEEVDGRHQEFTRAKSSKMRTCPCWWSN